MTSVLIVCGHVGIEALTAEGLAPQRDVAALQRGTGTRGEREWTGNAGPLLAEQLRARGVEVAVTDAVYHAELYTRPWDLIIALHLQRDRVTDRAFAARPDPVGVASVPYLSDAARIKSAYWLARFANEYSIVTGIPVTQDAVSANMTHYYPWDWPTLETPCVIVECGHADLDGAVLYELGIARVVKALALITLEYLESDLALRVAPAETGPAPAEPFPLASFAVAGVWDKDAAALEDAVARYAQGPVPAGWATTLVARAREAGIRADVAAAQAMHETGRLRFDGTDPVFSARLEWNNFGGLKTRDGTATAHFPTLDAGVKALVAHMAAYALTAHPTSWCADADPRHVWVPHTTPPKLVTLADYGGGVWNTSPRPQYGAAVAKHLAELRALIAAYVPPATRRDDKAIAAAIRELAAELERVA